jgi:hypothetical protein
MRMFPFEHPGRKWNRKKGLLETILPGGKRSFSIEIGVAEGAALRELILIAEGSDDATATPRI